MPKLQLPSQSIASRGAAHLGWWLAALHFGAFLFSVLLSGRLQEWAGVFVWPIWFLIDLPWSALHLAFLYPPVLATTDSLRTTFPVLDYLLYPPYFVHGVVGTVWWFFAPALYGRIRQMRSTR